MHGLYNASTNPALAIPVWRKAAFNPTHSASYAIRKYGFTAGPVNGNFYDLIAGKIGSVTGSPSRIIHGYIGDCVNYTSTATSKFSGNAQSPADPTGRSFTAAAIIVAPATGAQRDIVYSSNTSTSGLGFSLNATNNLQLIPNGSAFNVSTLALTANVPYFVAASMIFDGVSSWVGVYLSRRLDTGRLSTQSAITSNYGGGAALGDGTYIIGNNSAGTTPFSGNIAAVMFAVTFYASLTTLIRWSESPWDFWYPPDEIDSIVVGIPAAVTIGANRLMLLGAGQ